ncbi:MAG: cell division protein ZipA C-terminal FtsZ-binding domain-containing protein [Burkholderiales bacterium]|nr:cell division protein ZipA C-terminal FtsZ-binding domain-containing protein [Burkholderiales bacterium]
MSELQIGLLGIGVLVVVGVFAYNKLQEARLKRQSEEAFGSRHDDVLLGGKEPSRRPGESMDRIEPTLSASASEYAASGSTLDPGIDFILTLDTPAAVAGDAISTAIVDGLGSAAKAVGWEGFNPQTKNWEPLASAGEYGRLRVGMQLADRKGAASQQDLADFSAMVQAVAEAIGATVSAADQAEALKRAQQLDALCADVDVQIGLNLIARSGTIAGTRIRAQAEAHGLRLEEDGRFCRRDENGLELYSLCNSEPQAFSAEGMKTLATKGLTLLFDVARVPGGILTFDRFVEFVRTIADALSAGIVDDNRQPLDDAGLRKIRDQLQALYAGMEQQGIPAGSPLALRLFS